MKQQILAQLERKLLGASPASRERLLVRARAHGVERELLAAEAARPPERTACCGEHVAVAEPPRCFACGCALCARCCTERNGQGCPACGAGRTPSGGVEVAPLSQEEQLVTRLLHTYTGKDRERLARALASPPGVRARRVRQAIARANAGGDA